MGLFGGSSQSSASSAASSGLGLFNPNNEVSINKPIIDFSEPMQVLELVALMVIVAYAYKRFK